MAALLHLRIKTVQYQIAARPVMAPAHFSLKRKKRLFFIPKWSFSKLAALTLTATAISPIYQEILLLSKIALKNPHMPVTAKELHAGKRDPGFSRTLVKILP